MPEDAPKDPLAPFAELYLDMVRRVFGRVGLLHDDELAELERTVDHEVTLLTSPWANWRVSEIVGDAVRFRRQLLADEQERLPQEVAS